VLALLLWFAAIAATVPAPADIATRASPAEPKIRVLLLTGGHKFEREPFLAIFRNDPGIELTHLEHTPGTADAWDRADLDACDVVVLYDQPRTITETQKARFLSLFTRGLGLVVTHHSLVSYQRWPDYERIIGGRWVDVPEKGGDPRDTPSGFEHDVDIPVEIVDPAHPVTTGLGNFTIRDEIYWGYRVGADVTPLLATSHPKSDRPLAWTRTEAHSRIVYLLFAHGPTGYADPHYRQLLANAIRWTAPGRANRPR
jgi:hypothetical protein